MRRTVLLAFLLAGLAGEAGAQTLDSTWLRAMRWRSIGPAVMAGRVTDVEGIPGPSKTFYVASVTGGIWKTTNNGVTYRPAVPKRAHHLDGRPGHRAQRHDADLGGHG